MYDYERWKKGKKVYKAPWVIKYYESITDENQHRLAKKVENRILIIIGAWCLIFGIMFGSML